MVCFSLLHYTSLCISCDKNLGEFLMMCFMLWALCCSFLSIKIYVCTWVDLLFVNKVHHHIFGAYVMAPSLEAMYDRPHFLLMSWPPSLRLTQLLALKCHQFFSCTRIPPIAKSKASKWISKSLSKFDNFNTGAFTKMPFKVSKASSHAPSHS